MALASDIIAYRKTDSFHAHFFSVDVYDITPMGSLVVESLVMRRIFTRKTTPFAPAFSNISPPRRQTNSALCFLFFALTSAHGNKISRDNLPRFVSDTRMSARLVCFEASRYFLSVRPMLLVMVPGGIPLHFLASATKDALTPVS